MTGGFSLLMLLPCLVPLLLVVIWFILIYNRFVRLRQHVKESWADIDVELKRRYDLIPNLVETVKGYAKHERGLFESIASERTRALASTGRPREQAVDEQPLVTDLGRLLGLAEAYPELKADGQFLKLQEQLATTEDRLAAARRFYNANVRDLNTLRESFPTNIVAGTMGVGEADLFEVEESSERTVPTV